MLTTRALVLAVIAVAALAVGCGGSGDAGDESAAWMTAGGGFAVLGSGQGIPSPAGASGPSGETGRVTQQVVVAKEVIKEVPVEVVREVEVIREVAVAVLKEVTLADPDRPGWSLVTLDAPSDQSSGEQATLVAQRRIIVRTVEMALEVPDVAESVDAIGDMTEELGGWVVSSDRSRRHRGAVSVRVPAERLDEAIERLRGMASEVNAEVSTSRDVTDEYIDTTGRLKNLKATESALVVLLGKTGQVDDLLKVQKELTRVQEQMEQLQGRIKFLEQTSAYSLINVVLELEAVEMTVDAGPGKTVSVGQVTRFRASFRPPEGIEEFQYKWDFGDGSDTVFGTRTAPAIEQGTRFTATVNHVYSDDLDSPFIAEIEVTGTGDAGVAKGTKTILVTVTEIPTIEVFAGDNRSVEEGEPVELSGSFTRPEGLRDLTYEWDFGDGTAPATRSLAAGVTNALATHEYADHRPFPYTATLTIRAQSEAGQVEASSAIQVFVRESEGWVIAGWSVGDQGKTAVRSLSAVVLGLGTVLIWVAIFSPVWIVIVVIAVMVIRRMKRRTRSSQESGAEQV